ncbi:hypothetical protein PR002_g20049 [Phytophthora rubi]|uniref:Uncharacterized protein n=1 Tax=Phytophthora rubi TaxID=129364 RepID=A0A6A3JFY6_9STRA|nr:hypothetical protein PR002_g20049 [Phytophthora rubi]
MGLNPPPSFHLVFQRSHWFSLFGLLLSATPSYCNHDPSGCRQWCRFRSWTYAVWGLDG